MDLKNPFGVRDGKIILVEDLSVEERGLACNCVCPACKDKFEARLGNIRIHHFSHSGEGCDEVAAFLNGMYMLVKEFIDENELIIPALNVYWNFNSERFTEENFFSRISFELSNSFCNCTEVYPEMRRKVDCSELVYNNKKPIAIILSCGKSKVALCIKPPATVCKTFEIKQYKDMATISFDASNINFGELNKNDIKKMLLTEMSKCIWIYTDKALVCIDKINDKNDAKQKELKLKREEAKRKQKEKQRNEDSYQVPKEEKPVPDYGEKMHRKGYEQVAGKDFYLNNEPIYDVFGKRWVLCKCCGKKDWDVNFSEYGGVGSINLGVCRVCANLKTNEI